MPDPAQLRDSTQIVLPERTLADLDVDIDDRFMVTVTSTNEDGVCRVVGSPVVIKDVSDFLARNGVTIP